MSFRRPTGHGNYRSSGGSGEQSSSGGERRPRKFPVGARRPIRARINRDAQGGGVPNRPPRVDETGAPADKPRDQLSQLEEERPRPTQNYGDRPASNRPRGGPFRPRSNERPQSGFRSGGRGGAGRPAGGRPEGGRPAGGRPQGGRPASDRPFGNRSAEGRRPGGGRPAGGRAYEGSRGGARGGRGQGPERNERRPYKKTFDEQRGGRSDTHNEGAFDQPPYDHNEDRQQARHERPQRAWRERQGDERRGPRRENSVERSASAPIHVGRIGTRPLVVDPRSAIPAVFVRAKILHPLIYRKRLDRVEGAQPGDMVAVYNIDEQLSGYGIFNPRSEIAIRMLWHGPELPTDADWDQRLARAVSLRHETLNLPAQTDAYRVVHAESDGVSGLVVDRLGDVLSAEAFSLGMYQRAPEILERLTRLCGTKHTILQASPQFGSQEGCEPPSISSAELPKQVTIQEFGTRFRVRFEGGHKTGFFCDQRENRRKLAEFCAGKDVLDLCCYTGGFSVQAAHLGKAERVTGVDLDHAPLALAKENANLNQARVKFVQADAFAFLRDMSQNGRQFDVVVLDPPKLIRTRAEVEEGTRKHFALNQLAMQVIKPGGLLLTCSCAGLLPELEFLNLVVAASRRAGIDGGETGAPSRSVGRELRILDKSGAAPDHPVLGNCLETEYLKAIWAIVD